MFLPSIIFKDEKSSDGVKRYVWNEETSEMKAAADSAPAVSASDAPYKTLHVEDNPEIRTIVQYFLRKTHHVESAVTGDDALRLARENRYDVIIMDVNLGEGMDGIETTRRLREMKGYEGVPIIAVTANLGSNVRENCMHAGMDAFLPKPFQKEDLLNAIRYVTEQRARQTAAT